MNRLTILLSIIVLLFSSCSKKQKYKDADTFTFSDIPEIINLKGEIIELEDMLKPRALYIKDTVLFTVNLNQEYFVTTYSLNSMEKIGDYISFGSGPNEISSLYIIQFVDSSIWIYDHWTQRMFRYGYNQFLTKNVIIPYEIIRINDGFDKVFAVGDEFYAYSIAHPEHRFSVYDTKGKFIRNVGEIPDIGVDLTRMEMFESFFYNMVVLNSRDKSIFVACMNTDLIEIYANDTLKARKHGPGQFFSKRKEETNSEGQVRIRFIKGESRDAYFSPVVLDDEVWVTYDGKVFDPSENNQFLRNNILVFDWNGNCLRQYITDIPFYSLAIDKRNKVFYGITLNPEFALAKFNY